MCFMYTRSFVYRNSDALPTSLFFFFTVVVNHEYKSEGCAIPGRVENAYYTYG